MMAHVRQILSTETTPQRKIHMGDVMMSWIETMFAYMLALEIKAAKKLNMRQHDVHWGP